MSLEDIMDSTTANQMQKHFEEAKAEQDMIPVDTPLQGRLIKVLYRSGKNHQVIAWIIRLRIHGATHEIEVPQFQNNEMGKKELIRTMGLLGKDNFAELIQDFEDGKCYEVEFVVKKKVKNDTEYTNARILKVISGPQVDDSMNDDDTIEPF